MDSACTVSFSLSREETIALLEDVPTAYRTQINDVLLTALVQTFNQWTKENSLLVEIEGQGRETTKNLDFSRTVGCFRTIFPVLLNLQEDSQPGEALKTIKEQLRNVPNQGIGYGLMRYQGEDSSLPKAEVKFNYWEILPESSLLRLVNQAPVVNCNPLGNRPYLLEFNAFVLAEQLQMEWIYSEQIHQQTTIAQLATRFVEALRSLIFHCQSIKVGSYTPSDFPQANLSQKDLDKFLIKLNQRT